MANNGSRRSIKVSAGQPERAAELEVTKAITFYALLASLRALKGDTRERIEKFERDIKSYFLTCEVDLTPEKSARFRRHAQTTVEDLLNRIEIDQHPYKVQDSP